jgi:hypothetical protein
MRKPERKTHARITPSTASSEPIPEKRQGSGPGRHDQRCLQHWSPDPVAARKKRQPAPRHRHAVKPNLETASREIPVQPGNHGRCRIERVDVIIARSCLSSIPDEAVTRIQATALNPAQAKRASANLADALRAAPSFDLESCNRQERWNR